MLVLLDIKEQKLHIYTKDGMEVLDFADIDELEDIAEGQDILYVTKATTTTYKKIEKLVTKISGGNPNMSKTMIDSFDELDGNVHFIHATGKGTIYISDADMTFRGPDDCKMFDEEMHKTLQESFQMRSMIKAGKLEVIDADQMRKIVRKEQRKKKKFAKVRQEKEAKDLDSIIVKNSEPGSAADLAEGMFSDDDEDDPIVISEKELVQEEKQLSEDDILNGGLS